MIHFVKTACLFMLLGAFFMACGNKDSLRSQNLQPPFTNDPIATDDVSIQSESAYTMEILQLPDSSFGYEIYQQQKKIIRQEFIPSIPGKKGFSSYQDALKVALLVKLKLEKDIFPPTVTKKDLDSLNISIK